MFSNTLKINSLEAIEPIKHRTTFTLMPDSDVEEGIYAYRTNVLCPFCGSKLEGAEWRFSFAFKHQNDPEVLNDLYDSEYDDHPIHALIHVPESY